MRTLLPFLSCLLSSLAVVAGDEPARPNIVFIISDDLSHQSGSCTAVTWAVAAM